MHAIGETIRERLAALLADGTAEKALGWRPGEFVYDCEPAVFTAEDVEAGFVYGGFCGPNLSKYLIREAADAKVAVPLKPCDTYSFNQLVNENQINRDNVYILGIPCEGMLDIDKIRGAGLTGIEDIREDAENITVTTLYGEETLPRKDYLEDRCQTCKGKRHMAYDELLADEPGQETPAEDRFAGVAALEQMTAPERFAFWRGQLSRCIRCNACRNACPACTCKKCVFDNPASGVAAKANADTFEENMFHIIRAYHVAGRCTDCGECSRVCPQGIPLHLLNRKFIKDIGAFYGEGQAGETDNAAWALVDYTLGDIEPGGIRGGV